jgi:hypothetical protein
MDNFINKFYYILFLMLFLILCLSCSGESSPEITLTAVQDRAKQGQYGAIRKYLTRNTLGAIDTLKEYPQVSSWKKDFAIKFPEGSEWNIVHQEVKGDSARVTMKCLDHPVENVRGFEMVYLLRREKGIWKIDMHEELKRAIERIKEFRDFSTKQ